MKIIQGKIKKISRPVIGDVSVDLIKEMLEVCKQPLGRKSGGLALAHCQVDQDDPLRFFVLKTGDVIINPKILDKSDRVTNIEGCLNFPFRDDKKISRYNKIKVCYTKNNKSELIEQELEGIMAFIFQHEIEHFNGKTIYD
jgi:peptide deformylase